MTFSPDQIGHIEDRVMNLVQRPLSALQQAFEHGSVTDTVLLNGIADLERLVQWARSLREPGRPSTNETG